MAASGPRGRGKGSKAGLTPGLNSGRKGAGPDPPWRPLPRPPLVSRHVRV